SPVSRPAPSALLPWLDSLRCPHCAEPIELEERTLRCGRGHSFDLARAGYAPLLAGTSPTSGDDDDMARARDRFLATGAYAPLREAIANSAPPGGRRILDIGCGTGYYLAGVLAEREEARGLGVDTAVRALRFAARAHERAAAASWDVFSRFPLAGGSTDLVLDVFAPRHPEEFARVLAPGGHLLVVRPAPEHLGQLRAAVPGMVGVDPRKEERLREALDPLFTTVSTAPVRFEAALDAAAARDLVAMTPSARLGWRLRVTTREEGAPVADRRCVFIDFDGTFAHRGVAPRAHAEAVRRARRNGHVVLLCTGRPNSIIAPEVAALFDGVVASAGGWIQVGETLLKDQRFPEQLGRRAVEV